MVKINIRFTRDSLLISYVIYQFIKIFFNVLINILSIGVKTDLFQDNTPMKDDMSRSFDALQVIIEFH